MTTLPDQRPESLGGYIVHNIPFPKVLNEETLALLKQMTPIQIEQVYSIAYLHSYGQDSPFFAGLTNGVLLGSRDPQTGYTYANPRGHDMFTGDETQWVVLPNEGTVHAFTVCHFGSEEFLPECPFVLALIEFEGANTLVPHAAAGRRSRSGFARLDRDEGEGEVFAEQQVEADRCVFCACGELSAHP